MQDVTLAKADFHLATEKWCALHAETLKKENGLKLRTKEEKDQKEETTKEEDSEVVEETIEDLVRERMQKDPTLQGQKIDFGTSSDGTLEIWIDDERYLDVAAIPNEKIRAIIQEAVKAYNEGNA